MKATPTRSYYVDWLRVLAVLALFPFHAGQIYNSEAAFYAKDQVSILVIMGINSFIYLWHMPLFLFLAGIGSYYALGFRSGGVYLLERFGRLVIPLIFGTLVLIPPLTYIRMFGDPDKVWPKGFAHNAIPGFGKGYFEYCPGFFNGIYPNGNLDWGHLWFLAYRLPQVSSLCSSFGLTAFYYGDSGTSESVIRASRRQVLTRFRSQFRTLWRQLLFDRKQLREYDIVTVSPQLQPEHQVKPSNSTDRTRHKPPFWPAIPNPFSLGL